MSGYVSVPDALAQVARQVEERWAEAVCGGAPFFGVRSLGAPRSDADVTDVGAFEAWRQEWVRLPRDLGDDRVVVTCREVSVGRVRYRAPTVLRLADLDTAVRVTGRGAALVAHGRQVHARLVEQGCTLTPGLLRAATALADVDREVLVGVLDWVQGIADLGAWTARQVPVPGAHSKWLETHKRLVDGLSGRAALAELNPRPAHVVFTYLDPDHRGAGRRSHDSWTAGDVVDLAYAPDVVIVVENRDSRLFFPDLPRAIAVEGGGTAAASALASLPWLPRVRHIVYWGDVDCWGFEILDRLRGALGPDRVSSILMDRAAVDRYRNLGTFHHPDGSPIEPRRRNLAHLTPSERAAYAAVNDLASGAPPRIEQERIPLSDAGSALARTVARSSMRWRKDARR